MALAVDKIFDEIQSHSQNFETYDKQFTEVLIDLEGDDILETFRREYDQLHTSFVKSHEGEKRLIKKCQDLQIEIVACQYKIRTAEDLSLGDKSTIDTLKKEIIKARQKFEGSKETEITLKEKIKQLKSEIRDLDKQIEKGVTGAQKHEATLNELNRYKRELQKENDSQQTHLNALQHDIAHMKAKLVKIEGQRDELDGYINDQRSIFAKKETEVEDQKALKNEWERDLRGIKDELTARNAESQTRATAITAGIEAIRRLEEQILQQREEFEKQEKEYAIVNKKSQSLEQELEVVGEQNSQEGSKMQHLQQQVKQKESELHGIRREMEKVGRQLEAIHRTNTTLEIHKVEVETQRNTKRGEIQRLDLEMTTGKRYCDNDKKQIEDLKRERDILNKSYLKVQGSTQREKDWVAVKENQMRNLEHQLKGYERHAQKQRELVHQLEKETQGYVAEGVVAAQKYMKALEGLRIQETKVAENQATIHEGEGKLKAQQALYDNTHNERNLFSKQLLDLSAQIVDMDLHLDIIEQQIGQLKDEITSKDEVTTNEDLKLQKLEKEKNEFSMKIKRHATLIVAKDRKIAALNHQINKLNLIIGEADAEKCKQHRDCENVTNERDILGMQLIRRNDELAQLYERIRIQQSALKKGEAQYRVRVIELRQFEEKMRLLGAQLRSIKAIASRLPATKVLLNKTTKELNRAMLRCRALQDECENPTNVHRWRKMRGSQPQTYKMHQRMLSLQQELIEKHEEVEAKVRLISEKEQLYMELKSMLARQPGPEVAEQLNVYQDTVAKKSGQLKAMKESLKHFEQQLQRHESRFGELSQTMKQMRTTYKGQRRRQKVEEERQRLLAEILGKAPGEVAAQRSDEPYVGHTVAPLPKREPMVSLAPPTSQGPPAPPVEEEDTERGEDLQVEDIEDPPSPLPPLAPPGLLADVEIIPPGSDADAEVPKHLEEAVDPTVVVDPEEVDEESGKAGPTQPEESHEEVGGPQEEEAMSPQAAEENELPSAMDQT